ncbi:MAG: hypothetical protein ABWX96_15175, partial [Propionibacteriaceae bacterium]
EPVPKGVSVPLGSGLVEPLELSDGDGLPVPLGEDVSPGDGEPVGVSVGLPVTELELGVGLALGTPAVPHAQTMSSAAAAPDHAKPRTTFARPASPTF